MNSRESQDIAAMEAEPIDSPAPAFCVEDAESANWVVRKIAQARAYAEHVKAWADAELKRAQREEQFFLQQYGSQLEAWVRSQIEGSRRKSISLPAGVLGFRSEPTKLTVVDDQVLRSWCRQHLPQAIRVVETLMKDPLLAHLKTTGECPPGAEITGGNQRFYVAEKAMQNKKGVHHEQAEEDQ